MRLLVTGGAGFIGSNFIHHAFHARGHGGACCTDEARYAKRAPDPDFQLLNLDKLTYAGDLSYLHGVDKLPGYSFLQGDICDSEVVEKAMRDFRPDAVVHFAAESHVDRSIAAGDVFVRTNVLGTQVLLDAARRQDVPNFLHVSTDEVYGSIKEGSFREGDHFNPASPYSASKAGSDLLALAHHHTYGLHVQITRCTNNYGPRQNAEKLLPKTITYAMQGKKIPVYGNGMNVRDWLYVKDHCAAIEKVLEQRAWGEVWNIGARDERPNLDVIHHVLKSLGRREDLIEFVKDRPGHDWRYSLDDSKLRAKGWAPRTKFEDGLKDAIAWLQRGPAA